MTPEQKNHEPDYHKPEWAEFYRGFGHFGEKIHGNYAEKLATGKRLLELARKANLSRETRAAEEHIALLEEFEKQGIAWEKHRRELEDLGLEYRMQ